MLAAGSAAGAAAGSPRAFNFASFRVKSYMESPVATRIAPGTSTLYEVLGVQRQSDIKDIKSAFRNLARQSHPDVVPVDLKEESTKDFLRIHAAYTTLSNPEARARYDLQLSLQSLPRYTMIREHGDAFSFTGGAASPSSPPPPSPFSPSQRGRSWETDQCW